MSKKTKLQWDEKAMRRPGQAAPSEPHWIVQCLSRHHEAPEQRHRALFFRHPTEEAAIKEAQRLSALLTGRRFSVYGAGPSFKVEPETQKDIAA